MSAFGLKCKDEDQFDCQKWLLKIKVVDQIFIKSTHTVVDKESSGSTHTFAFMVIASNQMEMPAKGTFPADIETLKNEN